MRIKKPKAFTLAEVLLTITIMGVIAALTVPSLIQGTQKKELFSSLKKSQSFINAAVYRAENDYGPVNPKLYVNLKFYKIITQYFNVIKDCGLTSCTSGTDFVMEDYLTFSKTRNVQTRYFDDGQFMIADGSYIMLENPSTPLHIFITVDVNGIAKKPNAWGHDVFTFQLNDNGDILPMGADGTEFTDESVYCSKTSINALNGIGCTMKALTEKDYWDNLP